jgi:hypothetical protein
MNSTKYLDKKLSWEVTLATSASVCAIVVSYQLVQDRFFDLDILLFGAFAFPCSLALGWRFWDIAFGVTKFSNGDLDEWESYGIYHNVIGWSGYLDMILDHTLVFTGGFLIGFCFFPQLWLLTASFLCFIGNRRHFLALHNEKWKGKVDKQKLERTESFLKDKYRFSVFYFVIFLIGFFISMFPHQITYPTLKFLLNRPEFIPVTYILLLLSILILRFITDHRKKDTLKRFKKWWKERGD